MIEIKQDTDGFSIIHNQHEIIKHTQTKPCIYLGSAIGEFKDRKGIFKISETDKEGNWLTSFKIEKKNERTYKIILNNSQITFELIVQENENRLEITPTVDDDSLNRFKLRLCATKTEAIYGCGEQFSELNLRGKNVPIWIEEQGIGRGDPKFVTWILNTFSGVGGSWYNTYHAQPTFISSENYYCHFDSTYYSEFNFKAQDEHLLYVWGIPDKIYIGKYSDPLKTVENLTKILGRQPELPDWAYDGMWLAIQGKGGLNTVRSRLQKALDAGVVVKGIWSQDWQGIKQTAFGTQLFWDWKWDGGGRPIRFPNFPEFVDEMHKQGLKYFGYINSFLNIDGDLYKIAKEKNYCVKNSDGEDYLIYVTTFPAALIDLTNPAAYDWIKEIIKENLINEAHLDGWMSDFGEYLPPDAVLHSGISAEKFHNQYPIIWQKANYEAVKEAGKLGNIVYFTRSGYSHTSKYSTLVWGGDQIPTFSVTDGLASAIPAGLSLGVCGVGYHHTDIGGYTTFKPFFTRKKELFMRWAEHSTFTMFMRSHEGNQPENNIQFDSDDELLSHLAKMTKIHVHLKPYLQEISREYIEKGIPPMRALFLHYNHNPEVHKIKYQYLFGSDLLIAPVIKKGKTWWKVYIPGDEWTHIWTDEKYSKGWHKINAPIGQPPVFYRTNSKFKKVFNEIKSIQ